MAKQTISKEHIHDLLLVPTDVSNIIYEYVGNPFIITLMITYNTTVIIPLIISNNGLHIDWGDNTFEYNSKADVNIKHKYARSGKYIVHIFGDITNISFNSVFGLVEVSQWGNLRLFSGDRVFNSCVNLDITANDQLNLRYTKTMYGMFSNCCKLFYCDLSKWDVSNVTNMSYMFDNCPLFCADLSKWNVSNVVNMRYMFSKCYVFNADLSKWDVSKVTDMTRMFYSCRSFNSDLSRWDISNVKYSIYMFYGCPASNSSNNIVCMNLLNNQPVQHILSN